MKIFEQESCSQTLPAKANLSPVDSQVWNVELVATFVASVSLACEVTIAGIGIPVGSPGNRSTYPIVKSF